MELQNAPGPLNGVVFAVRGRVIQQLDRQTCVIGKFYHAFEALVRIGLLSKHRLGKDNFYFKDNLYQLLLNISQPKPSGSP